MASKMTGGRTSPSMRRNRSLPRTKRVHSKGREYLYFKTARVNAQGKPVYVKLPALNDPSFGATYAALMAGVNRKPKTYLTVTEFIKLYKASPQFAKRAPATQKHYSIYLQAFQGELPTAPAAEVERSDVAKLVDKRSDTPGAANALIRTIGALYRWGRSRGHVKNSPSVDIEPYELGEHEPWPDHVLAAALECDDELVRLATSLLYYTGQRIGDVCALRWSDMRGDWIELTQQKTDHDLRIPIHDTLKALLRDTPKRGLTILAADDGSRLKTLWLRKRLQKWVKENHGVDVVPHGLRKNAVNALLECGGSTGEVSSITGQSLQIVEHYAKGRNRSKMAESVMLKWSNKTGPGKLGENQ